VRPAALFWRAEEVHQGYLAQGNLDPAPDMPYWMNAYLE